MISANNKKKISSWPLSSQVCWMLQQYSPFWAAGLWSTVRTLTGVPSFCWLCALPAAPAAPAAPAVPVAAAGACLCFWSLALENWYTVFFCIMTASSTHTHSAPPKSKHHYCHPCLSSSSIVADASTRNLADSTIYFRTGPLPSSSLPLPSLAPGRVTSHISSCNQKHASASRSFLQNPKKTRCWVSLAVFSLSSFFHFHLINNLGAFPATNNISCRPRFRALSTTHTCSNIHPPNPLHPDILYNN